MSYLLGELPPAEVIMVKAWLEADEANARYFNQFKTIWDKSLELASISSVDENKAWNQFKDRIQNGGQKPAPVTPLFKRFYVRAIAAAAILISINWLVFIWAVNNNHIVESSMGYYINPLLTILLGTVVLKEKRDRWQTLSIVLAFTGVAYFTYQFGSLPWVAITLAVSFALYGLVKKMSPLNSLVGLTAETIMVAPFAVLYLIYQGSTSTTYESISISTIVLILLSGVVTSIPLLLFAKGAKRVSLTTLGFVQYITPTISLLIGVFVYGETFTLAHRICFVLIWISLLIYSTTRKKRG